MAGEMTLSQVDVASFVVEMAAKGADLNQAELEKVGIIWRGTGILRRQVALLLYQCYGGDTDILANREKFKAVCHLYLDATPKHVIRAAKHAQMENEIFGPYAPNGQRGDKGISRETAEEIMKLQTPALRKRAYEECVALNESGIRNERFAVDMARIVKKLQNAIEGKSGKPDKTEEPKKETAAPTEEKASVSDTDEQDEEDVQEPGEEPKEQTPEPTTRPGATVFLHPTSENIRYWQRQLHLAADMLSTGVEKVAPSTREGNARILQRIASYIEKGSLEA